MQKNTAYYHKNPEKNYCKSWQKLDGRQQKISFHVLSVKLTILQYHSKGQHDHQETSHITRSSIIFDTTTHAVSDGFLTGGNHTIGGTNSNFSGNANCPMVTRGKFHLHIYLTRKNVKMQCISKSVSSQSNKTAKYKISLLTYFTVYLLSDNLS